MWLCVKCKMLNADSLQICQYCATKREVTATKSEINQAISKLGSVISSEINQATSRLGNVISKIPSEKKESTNNTVAEASQATKNTAAQNTSSTTANTAAQNTSNTTANKVKAAQKISSNEDWVCSLCLTSNKAGDSNCKMCKQPRREIRQEEEAESNVSDQLINLKEYYEKYAKKLY